MVTPKLLSFRVVLLTILVVSSASTAFGATATFDTFPEGSFGNGVPFTDAGITFFDPIAFGGESTFVIERADATLSGPFFSPPNALTLSGFSPGPGAGFSQVQSFRMTTGAIENFISLELFAHAGTTPAQTITLAVFLSSTPVGKTSVTLGPTGVEHHTLSLSGVSFDAARLFVATGAWFGMVDDVTIETAAAVPEPATGLLVVAGLGVALLARRRRAPGRAARG